MLLNKHTAFVPFGKNSFLLKKKTLLIITLCKYHFIGLRTKLLNKKYVFLNKSASSTTWLTSARLKLQQPLWKKVLISYLFFFYEKIKFKGKGYKLKKVKKNKNLKFYFGHSHKLIAVTTNCALRRIKKFKYQLHGTVLKKIYQTKTLLKVIKPNNAYTKRGLRLARQTIFKRPGKKKTY